MEETDKVKLIDFEARFTRDFLKWCAKHPEVAKDEQRAADMMPALYEKWRTGKKSWLEGKSPDQYFGEMGDIQVYLSMLTHYLNAEMKPPIPLYDCIIDKKEEAYPILVNIIKMENFPEMTGEQLERVKTEAVHLIAEMDMPHPYEEYLNILSALEGDSALGDEIASTLDQYGDHEKVLEAYQKAQSPYARECLIDVLSGYSGDEEAFQAVLKYFQDTDDNIAFAASALGRMGDARALPYMKSALEEPFVDYFNYNAIKNALEQIEGVELPDKDFSGDSLYDYMKNMEDE